MAEPSDQTPVVRRVALTIDATTARHLFEVLDYIEMRHWTIDPDMFRIDLAQVERLKAIFTPGEEPAPVSASFSFEEFFELETIVIAADVYSHRKNEPAVYGVTDEELMALQQWCTETLRWFRELVVERP